MNVFQNHVQKVYIRAFILIDDRPDITIDFDGTHANFLTNEIIDVLPTAKAGGFLSENSGFQPVARFLVHRPKHSGVKAGASYTISRGLDSQIP